MSDFDELRKALAKPEISNALDLRHSKRNQCIDTSRLGPDGLLWDGMSLGPVGDVDADDMDLFAVLAPVICDAVRAAPKLLTALDAAREDADTLRRQILEERAEAKSRLEVERERCRKAQFAALEAIDITEVTQRELDLERWQSFALAWSAIGWAAVARCAVEHAWEDVEWSKCVYCGGPIEYVSDGRPPDSRFPELNRYVCNHAPGCIVPAVLGEGAP